MTAVTPQRQGDVGVDPMIPIAYRVLRKRKEIRDVVTLELAPVGGGSALAFLPGQFTMLYVFGVGEIPISVSGDPDRPEVLVQTIRAVGAVSGALTRLKRGDTVGVRGPFGTAWPVEAARGGDVLVMAGGLGLAPVRPILYELLAHRMAYGRVGLLYGARTHLDLLFRKELERWRSHLHLDVFVTVDRASAAWRGSVGVVTKLIRRASFEPRETTAFVCGPEVMMRFAARQLMTDGVSIERIFLSLERNMQCGIGLCGHCQYGPDFVCKDGPIFDFAKLSTRLSVRQL